MDDSLRATRDEVDKVVSEVIRKGVTVSSTEIAGALLSRFDVRLREPQEVKRHTFDIEPDSSRSTVQRFPIREPQAEET